MNPTYVKCHCNTAPDLWSSVAEARDTLQAMKELMVYMWLHVEFSFTCMVAVIVMQDWLNMIEPAAPFEGDVCQSLMCAS